MSVQCAPSSSNDVSGVRASGNNDQWQPEMHQSTAMQLHLGGQSELVTELAGSLPGPHSPFPATPGPSHNLPHIVVAIITTPITATTATIRIRIRDMAPSITNGGQIKWAHCLQPDGAPTFQALQFQRQFRVSAAAKPRVELQELCDHSWNSGRGRGRKNKTLPLTAHTTVHINNTMVNRTAVHTTVHS